MLQKYDTPRALSLLALAAASGAILALPATAEAACSLDDGYADGLVSYVAEVDSCLEAASQF
ncbi:MAG: hypothetical protein CME85_13945 [Henriciella sp.]|nr:hypothetical protein [Henriciella sp.]